MRASWMHLDLDAFFASVEQKLDPDLKGKPIVVGRVDPQGRSVPRGVVATASYEARKYGAKSGMPIFQALRLCPSCIVVGGHYEEYIKASNEVFFICGRYAPKIQRVSIDEAFLDFSGTDWIYPDLPSGETGLTAVAKKIKFEIKKEVGITASIGIASTKVVAKVASDYRKPDGLTHVKIGTEKKFLSPLPLRDLPGIGKKTEEYFYQIGIKTLGEIAAIPFEKMQDQGKFAINIWEAANGVDTLWFSPRVEAKSVSRSETFAENSADPKFILAMLQQLSEKVGTEVRQENYLGRCVYATIRYDNFNTVSRQRVLSYPTNITKEIYEAGETLLKELWDGHTPLRLVGIRISQFVPTTQGCEPKQLVLFDNDNKREKRLELEKRIDVLRSRHGSDSVVPASVLGIRN